MKNIIFIMLLLIVGVAKAQVGVGTPLPDNSAQLDIVSSDKGMLIPRLALSNSTDAVSITEGNVLSLLVFNIATAGDLTPGYHYWDGAKWQRIANMDDLITIINNDTDILIDNGDGTFTHTAADGTLTTFDANTTTIVDNGDGTYTITNDNGDTITLDVVGDVVTNIQNQGDIYNEIINLITANETLTTLVDNGDNTVTYTDEAGVATLIDLATIVDNAETLTILGLNADGINLDYQDEDGNTTQVNLAALEPWFDQANVGVGANLNTQDIYTMGRVAIGQNVMFGVPANEMLAVNGSIRTATSVYADYVFEDYLDGASIIKEDYRFKTIEEVDAYIKRNKHLPGVTSINDLVKTKTGAYSFNLSELSIQLLEKVEELYIHTIKQQNELKVKNAKIEALEVRLTKIEAALNLNYKN